MKLQKYFQNNNFLVNDYAYIVNLNPGCAGGAFALNGDIFLLKAGIHDLYGPCENSGEFASISIHELGHGLDCFDNFKNYSCNMTSPAEATADWISTLEFRDSCQGRGYYTSPDYNCFGYGDACINCTGIRDIDYAKHSSGQPWNARNSKNNDPNNGIWGPCGSGIHNGPCGWEDHCESGIVNQALWDLVNRQLIKKMDLPTAWQLAERLFYNAIPNIEDMYLCYKQDNIYNTNGCHNNSLYKQLLIADDDDGNICNGTPHGEEIYNALNAHLIACEPTEECPEENKDRTICASLLKPYLKGISSSGQNNLYWDPIENATKYIIYRNEVGCDFGYTKIAEVTNSCYADTDIYPGVVYYYRIQAATHISACTSEVSNCISLIAEYEEGICPAPGPPTLLQAEGLCDGIKLTWKPWQCGNSISYNIYRREGSCLGTYTKIAGPITGTTYNDTNVAIGRDYSYKIKATCDPEGEIESPFSNCLTARKLTSPGVPNAPTIEDVCNGLKVSWTEVEGAKSYNILRRDGGCGSDGWVQIASQITGNSYTDTNVQPGGTYGYSIEAVNDCGKSGKSGCSSLSHAAPDISGIVEDIRHIKEPDNTYKTEIIPREGVIIEDLTDQIEENEISDLNGEYRFEDVQGSTYHLNAYREEEFEGVTYRVNYRPYPYREVIVCKEDVLEQNFWYDIFVLPITGGIKGPIQIGGIFNNWTVAAYSNSYFDKTNTNYYGNYTLYLPLGTYKIISRKDCYVSYPPYITQTVSDSPISNINFQIIDWQVCSNCYATLYREQKDCGLLINPEECLANSILKFKECVFQKTKEANSSLYNAIILSVEVQRAKGQPEWESYNYQVEEEGNYFVNVTNGDYFNKETAVSSAEINLDGYGQLFGPQDFNKNVFELKKEIHLLPGNYTLNVLLRSEPGSYITIVISNKDVFSFEELP